MLLAKGDDLVGASWTTPRPRSPEQTDRPRNWGDGGDGESPSRTGDAKDAGKVIGRAGQNGRQAKALSLKVESALDQGLTPSLLLLNGFRRTGNYIPIIVIAAFPGDEQRALAAGAICLLRDLLTCVRLVLDR